MNCYYSENPQIRTLDYKSRQIGWGTDVRLGGKKIDFMSLHTNCMLGGWKLALSEKVMFLVAVHFLH